MTTVFIKAETNRTYFITHTTAIVAVPLLTVETSPPIDLAYTTTSPTSHKQLPLVSTRRLELFDGAPLTNTLAFDAVPLLVSIAVATIELALFLALGVVL